MSEVKVECKYTEEHEWISLEEEILTIGITDHAQESLGEIVFIELPKVGETFSKSSIFGAVESTKSVSDLYTPVSGVVTEVNTSVENQPELINQSPYNEGWMIKIKASNVSDLETLLSAEEYKNLIEE
ncbi:glycine cleavage system protein GcvH [bacterium]|jgi:glycine cleavage system H protein|nr:glycine cleavage system protein GcvH [bacterium]MBT3850247.1 glycine cleavage system protein GcvH [bacterium]MBT4435689.1 glycine cleavage system protein GcvH [bacterium]|tara:strand:+ start:3736 stop:4119 length:384 start_codon:yes stop_codon:yes gene_type:complete